MHTMRLYRNVVLCRGGPLLATEAARVVYPGRGWHKLFPTRQTQRRLLSETARRSRSLGIGQENLPRVAQPSLWMSLIPRPLRGWGSSKVDARRPPREWNPATFYIIIFLLIGSQAIQILGMRQQFTAFSRKADTRIELLREVIERIKNGEEVDIEGVLGTGNPEKEQEWSEVLKEIEREDRAWQGRARRKRAQQPSTEQSTGVSSEGSLPMQALDAASSSHSTSGSGPSTADAKRGTEPKKPIRYYL